MPTTETTPTKKNIEKSTTTFVDTITTTASTPIALAAKETTTNTINKRKLSESILDEINNRNVETIEQCSRNRKMWRNELSVNPNSTIAQPNSTKTTTHNGGGGSDVGNIKSHVFSNAIDIGIRIILTILFFKLETMRSFRRKIHLEELWLYKNPRTPDIVSPESLFLAVTLGPFITTIIHFLLSGDKRDFRAANWVWTLSLCVNGITTSILKITVGRPRPDFYYRCFPDGIMVLNNITNDIPNNGFLDILNCTGSDNIINEGHKSFPSGHSSFAFCGFGFIALYIGTKLHTFNRRGRGETWRLLITLSPIYLAILIAVSRTCDYHHHWQDVLVGGIIGLLSAYIPFRQYYPSIFSRHCHRPYTRDNHSNNKIIVHSYSQSNCYRKNSCDFDNIEYGNENDLLDDGYNDDYIINSNERSPLLRSTQSHEDQ